MSKYILFIAWSYSSMVYGQIAITDLAIEADKAVGTNRHWSVPKQETKEGSLGMTMRIESSRFYNKNTVNSFYTDKQFRYIGLDTEIGIMAGQWDVFMAHESEHQLDRSFDGVVKYPNQNSIGIRLNLIRSKK